MKKNIIHICLFLFVTQFVISQEAPKPIDNKSNTIFVQSGFWTPEGKFDYLSLTANYERLIKTRKNGYVSFSIGIGSFSTLFDNYSSQTFVNTAIDKVLGNQNHFFEAGAGVIYIDGNGFLNPRFGYRLMVGNRFMFRCLVNLFIPSYIHGFSISLGYRLGGNSHKNK